MKNNLLKKKLSLLIFFLFVGLLFMPLSNSNVLVLSKKNIVENQMNQIEIYDITVNNGTLSGYVTDSLMNPIDGALIRVNFHETYEEAFSDVNGYYHVTNIPLCWCMKNCTCSKDGYKTEWVLMAITENTTYDFTLYSLYPYPFLNGSNCNGWWNSPVTVTFIYDPEEVAEIWYYYEGWHLYNEPFVIDENGEFELECYWVDYYGQQSPYYFLIIPFDQLPPTTDLTWETYKELGKWYVKFTLNAVDSISGMSPYVEFYLNDVLQGEFEVDWPTFEFEIQWNKAFENTKFGFLCSDIACNSVMEDVNGSEIESLNNNHNLILISQNVHNIIFLRIVNFIKNEIN